MQNKLMNGVNGMSEFEKELENLAYNSRTGGGYKLFSEIELKQAFGNWQPSKPLVKVERFVADWFENHKDNLDFSILLYLTNWEDSQKTGGDFYKFMNSNPLSIETLIRMKLEGYIVVSG